ncbi:spermidine/putrescine ABC transporter permease [Candidatus Borrelia fainii]|uniref:Spermidine/putrescine ABC transporter permease n=2 Tax=Borrelia TaxID=138 RepID=A0ABM8DJC5_9SPIR|nr:ABC transporter permease [Candidatus Borrelia fainii]BDU62693.1 spermidine/putrescine ABC transporter permease [Candidatus Borrelia fainii]
MLKILKNTFLFLTLGFVYAPILILIIYSFNAGNNGFFFQGFSLKWYKEVFASQQIKIVIYNTLLVAIVSSLISIVIGVLGAYSIYKTKNKKIKTILLSINKIPIINPDIVTGISLMTFFSLIKIQLGFSTMLMSHIIFSTPYIIIIILPKLYSLSENIIDAARDLGASEIQIFKNIICPEIIGSVVTGGLIAFTLSVDDFLISFFTTGQGFNNLSILINSLTKRGIKPIINAISSILFFVILSLLFIINKCVGIKKLTVDTEI